jgi:hypothetical protein
MLAGFVAGEGSFVITTRQPPFHDGTPRLAFVFDVQVASRDRSMLERLQTFLGFGSITDLFSATIPWADAHLLPCAKRTQYELWRDALFSYDQLRPSRFAKGPSPCNVDGCDKPVRGRGLCRSHYYRATGY